MRIRRVTSRAVLPIAVLYAMLWAGTGAAQQTGGTYSGYSANPKSLEGGDSVTEDLSLDDENVGAVLEFPKVEAFFQPFFDWKKRLNDRYGLKLQFSYQTLYQTTPDDVPQQDAFAGRGQIQGSWALLNRGTQNEGMVTFRLENRTSYDGDLPPSQFGYQFGSVTPTGTGFSDFGFAVTELAWRQSLADGNFKFILGKISAISWYNVHALSSSMRGFQNTGLQSSLSKPAPGRGFGMGFGAELTPHFVVVAGIHDANAKTAEDPFDTIGEGEFYHSVELRYLPSTPDRWRFDQLRLQFWHQDALKDKGVPESHGMTVAASRLIDDRYFLFGFGGLSDGNATLFEVDAAAGFGIAFDTRHRAARDVLGIGASWGKPANDALREQYTGELFYRFQLVERVALTPSLQYIRHPAADPMRDDAVLFGLRTRLTF